MLGSSRCPEFKTEEGRKKALRVLEENAIEALVIIGGNGSQSGAHALSQMGFPVVGVASTIDNDLYGSEITIGVDTALDVALVAIDQLKVTASSHHRAFIVEVMGRDCGYLALVTGITGGAEYIVIPEFETDAEDVVNAIRETLTPYGCGHSSSDATNVWISQNLWRDVAGRYLGAVVAPLDSRYWDLQVFSNTDDQSFGCIDTYIGNELCFYPRGATAFGFFLAGPRLQIDRLAKDGAKITIAPDRYRHSRWPLLPLADWAAGKIPVCVVDGEGRITIEGEIEKVQVVSHDEPDDG
jgi:hypothetical protein